MRHEFVEFLPEKLKEDVLYVSIEYKTAAHLCACGCKKEVITPISPTDWKFTFNGESISLSPSIGNWDFPCRSHYFITKNMIVWAGDFTDEQVEAVKNLDRENKVDYYGKKDLDKSEEKRAEKKGIFERFLSLFKR